LALIILVAAVGYGAWQYGYLDDVVPRDRVRALWPRAPVGRAEPDDALSGEPLDAPLAGIQVFFAPCSPLSPLGIDDRLVGVIAGAQRSVYCAFYELQLDRVADALIERHHAGVDVGIVSDSHYDTREAVRACIDAGIRVVFDKRESFMHNKCCVVDGVRVWTGSTNVTENGMFRNDNNAVLIESPDLAENFTLEFREMFDDRSFGGRSPRNTAHPTIRVGHSTVECYFAPEDGVEREILAEIAAAKISIDFLAFSFTSKPIAEAMAARARQGVAVRGVFEQRNAGSKHSQDDYLAEHGADIRMDRNPYNMHNKVIILDELTVITGSYNFSASAEQKNDENVVILHVPEVARRYGRTFEALFNP